MAAFYEYNALGDIQSKQRCSGHIDHFYIACVGKMAILDLKNRNLFCGRSQLDEVFKPGCKNFYLNPPTEMIGISWSGWSSIHQFDFHVFPWPKNSSGYVLQNFQMFSNSVYFIFFLILFINILDDSTHSEHTLNFFPSVCANFWPRT